MALSTLVEVKALLNSNQPMPDDSDDAFDYDAYCDVIEVLVRNPDRECVELFLSSLHDSSNELIGQSFAEVLRCQELDATIEQLTSILLSDKAGPKCWATEYAIHFPDTRLISPLAKLLRDPASPGDNVIMAVTALEKIAESTSDPAALEAIKVHYEANPLWAELRSQVKASQNAFRQMHMEHAITESEKEFRAKEYDKVVSLLAPFEKDLPEVAQKRLALAKRFIL